MRTFAIIAILCFSMLFAIVSAQEPSAEQQQIEKKLRYLVSPMRRLEWEAEKLAGFRSPWNGQGSWAVFRFMTVYGDKNELGLTDEQKQRFSFHFTEEHLETNLHNELHENPTPEYTQAMEALKATLLPGDPYLERATEEQKNAFREAESTLNSFLHAAMQKEIQEILTPEQMLQLRKLEMQLMPALGVPFPAMFDPLDLTDEQKKEMNKITEEMKTEYDKLIIEALVWDSERISSMYEPLRGKSFASQEEFQKACEEARKTWEATVARSSEAQHKKFVEHMKRGIEFTTLLQTRLMNVLTDEQLDKMQTILDETPMFAKKIIATIKIMQAAAKLSPTYVPGPDSWRPGDPVPEQFKEERQRSRFSENQTN